MDATIDSRQLRTFIALAHSGSFTQAGREVHLTQSAISHAIKALENDLGAQLFHREGKSVYLTHAGVELLSHAESIVQIMSQARASLNTLDQSPKGKIRVGCTTAAAQFILPTVLREFKESFPLYEIQVVTGETPDTIEKLLKKQVDITVSLRPKDTDRLTCRSIFHDELEFLVSPHHPWAQKAPKIKEAANQTFIVASRNSLNFILIQDYFMKQGVRLQSFIELGSSEAAKELAKLGLGVVIAARWIAKTEIEAGQLVARPLPKGKLKRSWVVSTLKSSPLNLPERTFVGLCEEMGHVMEK